MGSTSHCEDDVIAVMMRFLPMAQEVSRAGYWLPYIDDLGSL